jgi:hypothetical protein
MTRLLLALILVAPAVLAHDDDDEVETGTAWVLVRDAHSSSMNGSMKDLKVARRHLHELPAPFLWFRKDGKQYVVRDGKMIDQLQEAARPQEELGAEQARLGQRQAELGQQQAGLGRRQAELGNEQARTAMRRAHREMNGERSRPVDREAEQESEETQRELSKAQQTLGREQEKLGYEQQKLGEQQQKLSRQFQRKVEELIATALQKGAAKPVQD